MKIFLSCYTISWIVNICNNFSRKSNTKQTLYLLSYFSLVEGKWLSMIRLLWPPKISQLHDLLFFQFIFFLLWNRKVFVVTHILSRNKFSSQGMRRCQREVLDQQRIILGTTEFRLYSQGNIVGKVFSWEVEEVLVGWKWQSYSVTFVF